jgi:2-polyprenyl-3-methyl-5-hydroxy-6-metoxy-1,4-benzoquinol methylase
MSQEVKNRLQTFYEEVGAKYPEQEIVYHNLRGILRKNFVLSHLKNFKGRFLDVGCNRGMYLGQYKGGNGFGIDLSHNILRLASQILQKRLIVGNAERLFFFKRGSFDAVLCSEVLEHCLNPNNVFEGLAYILRPSGKALITTPNYRNKKPDWIDLGELRHYDVHSDCNDTYFHTAFRPEELCEFARSNGLKVVEFGTLEKEVKYATKIPVIILLAGRLINRVFHSVRFEHLNQKLFERLSLAVYKMCRVTGVDRFLVRLVKEGVRSYVIVTKPC